jgi:hypothetical protein
VERALDHDDVINLWLECFKYYVELPSTTTALVNYEFCACFEGSKRFEAHLEDERIVWAHQAIVALLEEHRSLNQPFVLRILNVQLEIECILRTEVVETWQKNPQSFIVRLTCTCLEVIVNGCRGTFGNTSERVLPNQLLAHADNNRSFALSHGLRRERIWDLENTERSNAELVSLQ